MLPTKFLAALIRDNKMVMGVLTEIRPDGLARSEESSQGRWMSIIFNNDYNSMDEVVDALIDATSCDEEEAAIEAWEAHVYGEASVHFSTFEVCQEVCASLSTIGLKTEVRKEWED